MTERRLFGTDGVRGVAGEFLTADLALRLGRAAALESDAERPQVLIIRDTRESGPMLEDALAAGVASAGGDAILGGVLPSPAASVLARRYSFDLAAIVSASHNPFSDNGVKFMSGAGTKLSDEAEAGIEDRVKSDEETGSAAIGRVRKLEGALDDYLRELRTAFPLDLSGMRVALDCANGAAYRAGPATFERLGAEVTELSAEPDGRNINLACGSTAPGALAELLASGGADVGFAFDGDADRLVAVDGRGRVRDGDELIALAARHLSETGELRGGVAVTVMTNYGFHKAMEGEGIPVAQTDVGDRYVLEELERRDWSLGGEQSGHIIWRDYTPSGDGIGAALLTLRALGGDRLEDVEPFERLPQRLENVEVADRDAIVGADGLWAAVEKENAALEGRGRVLVRPSGTEPLLRIMVEAPEESECDQVLGRLAAAAREELS
ncbi:MAG: phosphoglucosamine mutase [Solirubrobacterales bacterium]|nr:phosphoglucosamine mutase [Solirubrobacterales bacterium]